MHDLVDVARQLIAENTNTMYTRWKKAYTSGQVNASKSIADSMLVSMLQLDTLLGTRQEFLLGAWLQKARAMGVSQTEKDRFEVNAKTIITTWGGLSESVLLKDYGHRHWQGLVADFYAARWKYFFESIYGSEWRQITHPQWYKFEKSRIENTKMYTGEASGDPVVYAGKVIGLYAFRP